MRVKPAHRPTSNEMSLKKKILYAAEKGKRVEEKWEEESVDRIFITHGACLQALQHKQQALATYRPMNSMFTLCLDQLYTVYCIVPISPPALYDAVTSPPTFSLFVTDVGIVLPQTH